MSENPIQRLKTIEKEITTAETEVAIRKRQLQELTPQRREIEAECQKNFGCNIDKLDETLNAKTQEMEQLVTELEADLVQAKGVKKDD